MESNLAVIIFSLLFVGFVVTGLILLSKFKGKWGVNLQPIDCPQCGEHMPAVRIPASSQQALWGGHTCNQCGCEMDKWGKKITDGHKQQLPAADLNPPVNPLDERQRTPVERVINRQ